MARLSTGIISHAEVYVNRYTICCSSAAFLTKQLLKARLLTPVVNSTNSNHGFQINQDCDLKGWFAFFEVGLYEVLIHNQCITCSRFGLAQPQFGKASRSTSMEAKQHTAVDGASCKMYFRLKKAHIKKKSVSV